MAALTYNIGFSAAGMPASPARKADGVAAITAIDTAVDAVEAGSLAAVVAATAVLVADAALPTQAHVNTLDAAMTTLVADIAALQTGPTAAAGAALAQSGVTVLIDTVTCTTRDKLRLALDALRALVRGNPALAD